MSNFAQASITPYVSRRKFLALGVVPDYEAITATKSISGTVYSNTGSPVSGATVELYREDPRLLCQTQVTGAGGAYLFPRDAADPYLYYTVSYKLNSPQIHGTSDRNRAPA